MPDQRTQQLTACLHAAQHGDQRAFARLCEAVCSQRCRLALIASTPRRLRSKIDPEDILQLVLIRAWRGLEQLGDVTTQGFRRWIGGLTRHVIVDVVRRYTADKRRVTREVPLSPGAGSAIGCSDQTPSRSLARREELARLVALLDELKDSYRHVVIHRVLYGCTTEETAERLDTTPENVRVTLCRALAKLDDRMAELGIRSRIFSVR